MTGRWAFRITRGNGTTLQNTNWVVNYGLGARGIDFIENLNSSLAVTSTKFPLYDAHGNMVATLARNGTGCTLADSRSYDAWGVIRTGNTTGDPRGRYCASIGHKVDDENGLIYMRARYYEPSRGRFISEDHAREGENWFCYASNNPIDGADAAGSETISQAFLIGLLASFMKLLTENAIQFACGKAYSAGDIMNLGLRWLLEGGVMSGALKAFESQHSALTWEQLLRKLKFGVSGGLLLGGAVGAIMGLRLGEYCGKLMYELFEMEREACPEGW